MFYLQRLIREFKKQFKEKKEIKYKKSRWYNVAFQKPLLQVIFQKNTRSY